MHFDGNMATVSSFEFREDLDHKCNSAAKCLAVKDLDLWCADQIMHVLDCNVHQIDAVWINLPEFA